MIEQVTIVGMGALGILYGDRLSRYLGADHVRFLAAGERLERYRRKGPGATERSARPSFPTEQTGRPSC